MDVSPSGPSRTQSNAIDRRALHAKCRLERVDAAIHPAVERRGTLFVFRPSESLFPPLHVCRVQMGDVLE
jgi:hypothetical protein